ncbi:phosphatase 2C-like domain-containing protein, partial [Parasitella parasitica]
MNKDADRAYFGVFDGLSQHLHERIENISLNDFHDTLEFLRSYRGYFRRFPIPNAIRDYVDNQGNPKPGVDVDDLTVEQRLTLAFLSADASCLRQLRGVFDDAHEDNEGSTGSVAIIEPVDKKSFWESEEYDIIIGHVGDTRILLCDSNSGQVVSLTTGDHHPGNPIETDRLRKYAGFVTTDSWGDERIMGMLATSRAFGDAKLKRYGVSAEPDIVLVTDGITSVMSDQEIVDFVKQHKNPTLSAKKLVDAADQLQSDDNTTAVVVRLKDWGKRMQDYTKELRAYRLENTTMNDTYLGGGQSLEDELLGEGYLNEVPLGSSLAAELQSATSDDITEPSTTEASITTASTNNKINSTEAPSKLAAMAMDRRSLSCEVISPLLSPLQWSASTGIRSRRSSWSSINDPEDDDPFEVLKRQLEDLNTAVWETKTLHKRLVKTLALDETLQNLVTFAPPFE